MRFLLLSLALLGLALAQKGLPEGFAPAPGPVYVVPGSGLRLSPEVWTKVRTGPVRVLWQPNLMGQKEVEDLVRALRARGLPTEVRAYRAYPSLGPVVVGPNWALQPPDRWTVWAVEVGALLKVVDLAWQKAR